MNERLTQAQIEAIRQRAEKATEGPWEVYDEYCDTVERKETGDSVARVSSIENRNNDMHFIAHARDDIPVLLAEVDRLQAELNTAMHVMYSSDVETEKVRHNNARLIAELKKADECYEALEKRYICETMPALMEKISERIRKERGL